jgi:DNA replication protein DnaC
MRTPIKAELKEMLRRLKLPTFATQHAAQSALAASEGWSCDQYLLRLCEMEINERETRKRERLLQASRLPREKTLENFERSRLKRNIERQFAALLDTYFAHWATNSLSRGEAFTSRRAYCWCRGCCKPSMICSWRRN